MGIKKYNQKRNFKQTTEPKGEVKNTKGDLVFVVQKHKASHLHFDFRLELNGVLKSWAVPKGPSVNPVNKRLAMMVEDHPYDYKDFEGTIPEGNYGAGTVIVWDEGTYHALGLEGREESEKALAKQIEEGSIKIVMNGKKLKGEFALVKIKNPKQKNAWLLIKHNDEFASDNEIKDDTSVKSGKSLEELEAVNKFSGELGADFSAEKSAPTIKKKSKNLNIDLTGAVKAPIENNINPTLATLSDKAFDSKEWLFEIKLDG